MTKHQETVLEHVRQQLKSSGLTVADLVTAADWPAIKKKFDKPRSGGGSIH